MPIDPWPIALTASSRAAEFLPVIATLAPSSAKSFAVARPRPLLPPVMTATLFANFFIFWIAMFFHHDTKFYRNCPKGYRKRTALYMIFKESRIVDFNINNCSFPIRSIHLLEELCVLNSNHEERKGMGGSRRRRRAWARRYQIFVIAGTDDFRGERGRSYQALRLAEGLHWP